MRITNIALFSFIKNRSKKSVKFNRVKTPYSLPYFSLPSSLPPLFPLTLYPLSLSLSSFSSVWRQRRSPRIFRGFRSLRRREMPEIRSSRGINTHKRIWAKPFISLECVVAADEPAASSQAAKRLQLRHYVITRKPRNTFWTLHDWCCNRESTRFADVLLHFAR